MATVSRFKKKKHEEQSQMRVITQPPSPSLIYQSQKQIESPLKIPRSVNNLEKYKNKSIQKHNKEKQQQYEQFYKFQNQLAGVITTSSLFPHNIQLNSQCCIPLAFMFSPILQLQNADKLCVTKQSEQFVPRCPTCKAYRNCYDFPEQEQENKKGKKKGNAGKYTCFFCNRQNTPDPKCISANDPIFETPIYQTKLESRQPSWPSCFVFMIDISRFLYYAVAAIKQVLSRPEMDSMGIYFFTFDQVVSQYGFQGEEVSCRIIGEGIQGSYKLHPPTIGSIRDKLMQLLDCLEDICESNTRIGYNFSKCFDYLYNSLKHTGSKFYILQSSQQLIKQPLFSQISGEVTLDRPQQKPKNLFETQNKTFLNKYGQGFLQNQCSCSFFSMCSSTSYKNLRTVNDFIKLTGSELKVYTKGVKEELDKFYYQFCYLLGSEYFTKVKIDVIVSGGWNFSGIYGNFYRLKNSLTFQIGWVQPSRKMLVMVSHSQKTTQISPFCCIQLITKYNYKGQNYMTVSTIVQPVTGYIDRFYSGIDPIMVTSALMRQFFSSLRVDQITNSRKKLTESASKIYLSALQHFKTPQSVPDSILRIISSTLAMLKSVHSQPELVNNTHNFDRLLSERIMLQFTNCFQIAAFFGGYLFDFNGQLDADACEESQNGFVYPPTIQLKFNNVKQGIFLLDAGLYLYLFIAKTCPSETLNSLFSVPKLNKNTILTEQLLFQQQTALAFKIQNLIKFLRQQKSYGWVPLYIVRCGQNSSNERNFYLNFYQQKYEQFKSYNLDDKRYLQIFSRPNFF